MLFNPETQKPVIVVSKTTSGALVTGDGVIFDEVYSLIYEIPGYKPVTYQASGEELANSVTSFFEICDIEGDIEDLSQIGRELNEYLTLWATRSVSLLKFKLMKKRYEKEDISLINKHFLKSDDQKDIINLFLETYFYIRLTSRDHDNFASMVLHIIDYPANHSSFSKNRENWKDQPVTKRMGFKTYDEFVHHARLGFLVSEWHFDLNEYETSKLNC